MSTTIDQKVVEMRFDNKDFESNVKTSMSTIEKLKKSLHLDGATKGLENVGEAAKKVNMTGLSNAVDTVRNRFSALEVMGVTALVNITNSAVNAGKRMVKALTLDPVKSGFQEYETQINAVQTILANTSSKGTTLEDVNKALDELNKYADKTIYNFTEMTRNIGTFTAAGIDLETSTNAIQGIANLAAVSGSTSQQASTAMYQLSQALASGTVKLMDWNSVVNAGMGGQVFQDALKETARVHGINIDKMIDKEGSFRETLQKGWLSSEILTETLQKFTLTTEGLTAEQVAANREMLRAKGYTDDQITAIFELGRTATDAATKVKTFTQLWDTLKEAAQSGWTQTWEIIIGDFGEAKELFTEISDTFGKIIGDSAEARNNLLEGAMSSNWEQLTKRVNDAGVATEDFQKALLETAKKHGLVTDEMIAKEGAFDKALKEGVFTKKIVRESLFRLASASSSASNATSDMTDKLTYFQKVVDEVWNGNYKNGEARIKALTDAGYDYAKVQDLVNKTVDGHRLTLEDLSDVQLESIGYTKEQISAIRKLAVEASITNTPLSELIEDISKPSGRELLIDSFRNALKGLLKVCRAVKEAWSDIFPPMTSKQLYNIIENIHNLSKNLNISDDTARKLKRTFKGLFAAINIVTTITGGALKTGLKILCNLLGMAEIDVLSFTASLGDSIVAFRDWLFEENIVAKGLTKLIDIIKMVISVAKDLINEFLAIPEVANGISAFREVITNTFADFNNYFEEGGAKINEFIERVKSLDSITLDDLGNILKDFRDNVLDYFFDFDGNFESLSLAYAAFTNKLDANLTTTGEALTKFKDEVVDIALKVKKAITDNIIGIISIAAGFGVIKIVMEIRDVIETLAGPIDALTNLLDGLGKGISKYLKASAFAKNAEGIKTLAISVAILSASVAALAIVNSKYDIRSAVIAVAALSGVLLILAALSKLISSIGNSGPAKMTVPILALSSSILILVVALRQMDDLSMIDIDKKLGIIAGFAIGLGVISGILGAFVPQMSKNSLFMLSFAGSILLLSKAIMQIPDAEDLTGQLLTLAGAVGSLVLIAVACRRMRKGTWLTLLAIVIALKGIVNVFEDIADVDTYKAKANLEAFIAIFGMFAILMKSSHLAGQYADKAGVAVLFMSGAMLIIIQAIKMVAEIPQDTLARSVGIVSWLMALFAGIIAVSKLAGENAVKAGIMLGIMAGAIVVLTGVMWLLSKMDPDGLWRALGAISALELVFGVLIGVTKLAQNCKGTLIVLTVAATLLSLAIMALSTIDSDKLLATSSSLSMVIGAFAVLVAATSLAKQATGTILLLTAVVGGLGFILNLLAGMPVGSAWEISKSLSLVLVAMSAAMLILGNAKAVSLEALGSLAILGILAAGLGAFLAILSTMNVGPTIELAASMSILLTALSANCLLLSALGKLGAAAIVGTLILGGVIAGLLIVFTGLGTLAEMYPELEIVLDKCIPVLEKIGYGLGSFLGNIIGGFSDGVLAGLPAIGTHISGFMTNLAPFIEGANNVKPESAKAVKSLAEAILVITAANVLDSITKFLSFGTSSFEKFGEGLEQFGKDLKAYGDAVDGIKSDVVSDSATAAKALAELNNNIPNSGGKLAKWIGDNTWTTFSRGLVKFGRDLKEYSFTVDGMNSEAVTNSVTAAQSLAGLNDNLPNSGGILAYWIGDNTWDTFREGLITFGVCLKTYSLIVAGLDRGAVENSAIAAGALAELNNKLPNTGGILADWIGDNTLGDFGANLKSFGENMVAYSNTIKGVDQGVVSSTTAIIETLVRINNSLGKDKLFTDDIQIDNFGNSLLIFADDFVEYYTMMSSIELSGLLSSVNSINKVIDMAQRTSLVDDEAVSSFGDALTKLGSSGIDGFINAFNNSHERIKKTASEMIDNFINEINGNKTTFKSSFMTLLEEAITAIKYKQSSFKIAGINLMVRFIDGIKSKTSDVATAFNEMVTKMVESIQNGRDNFYRSGAYLVEGFANGINGSTYKAKIAAEAMAKAALEAAREELDINSPSKKFYDLGDYSGQGFVGSLYDYADKAYDAGSEMGKSAEDGLDSAVSTWSFDKGETLFSSFGDTVAKGAEKVKEFTSNAWNSVTSAISGLTGNTLNLNSQGLFGGLDNYKAQLASLQDEMADYVVGSDEWIAANNKMYNLTNKINNEEFNNVVDLINSKKYNDELTLQEELAAWTELKKKYAEGSDEYVKASKEIARVRKEAFEADSANIEELKSLNKLSLIAELAAWKKIQKKYEEGTDERKKADKEIYNIQKEIRKANEDYYKEVEKIHKEVNDKKIELDEKYLDKSKEVNKKLEEDIERVNESYEDSVKSRTDTLLNSYSLFDKVEKAEAADGSVLTENLMSQIDALSNWTNNINSLASRGVDSILLEELRSMGPSAAAEIAGLNNMSADELDNYVSLWRQKYEMAKNQAVYELQDLRAKSDDEISQLRIDAAKELSDYKDELDAEMAETNKNAEEKLTELRTTWKTNIGLVCEETTNEFVEMSNTIIETIGEESQWNNLGTSMIENILKGVVEKSDVLDSGIKQVMTNALNEAKKAFSKSSVHTGSFYQPESTTWGFNSAGNLSSSLSSTSQIISGIVSGEIDSNPTIRPVIDMTDFDNGINHMTNSLNQVGNLSATASTNTANKIASGMNSNYNSDGATSTGQNGATFSFTQNNYSPKALNRIDIYRQTNNQFSALKGMI